MLPAVAAKFRVWLCLLKILHFVLDRFWKVIRFIPRSELSAREILRARPAASEHGHGGATKWATLMARSELYNLLALLHAQSMADNVVQSSNQR